MSAANQTNHPSLCIPHAHRTTNSELVKSTLEKLFGAGCVKRVDVCALRDSRDQSLFKRYFIHFNTWTANEVARNVREKFLAGETVKIVYEEPRLWKCSVARSRGEIQLPKPRDEPSDQNSR